MPEEYREPLILFYREERSVAEVAAQLDLSEDAAKQRLSRGRAMLRGRMEEVVESALARSKPKAGFATGVLAALAVSSPGQATAAGMAVAGGGAGAAVTAAMVAGPAAGLSVAWLASVAVGRNAHSEEERRIVRAAFGRAIRFCVPMVFVLVMLVGVGLRVFPGTPGVLIGGVSVWTAALLAYLIDAGRRLQREIAGTRREPAAGPRFETKARWMGLPLFAYGSVGLDAGAPAQRAVRAWIAVGDLAISPLVAIGGIAIAPVAIGGITVGVLSISVAGVAVGVLAVGSLAAGWWAFGMGAVGWQAAAGGAVVARDYAVGGMAQAAEANTAVARAWFAAQWFTRPVAMWAGAVPWLIGLAIVVPLALLFRRAVAVAAPTGGERLHGLDALRAAALLGGVVLHSSLHYLMPPGVWAVGTREPQLFVGWAVYYLHSFRMALFFLLAGYFGAVVAGRRGTAGYLRDRLWRILLVFAVALYPMKFALHSLWIVGGWHTGWLKPGARAWYAVAAESIGAERWPAIGLTHLWFLYVLFCVTVLFLAGRAVAGRLGWSGRGLRRTVESRVFPLGLAAATTGLLAGMKGMDIDTPDQSFAWHWPVMGLYGIFFSLGWWLQGNAELLDVFRRRWKEYLIVGLVASFVASTGIGMRYGGGAWVVAHATELRWATAFGTALTMAASVFGWLGAFLEWFPRQNGLVRRLADASYWIYVAHLPVVVGLQILLAGSGAPWWVQVPVISVATVAVLLAVREFTVSRAGRDGRGGTGRG